MIKPKNNMFSRDRFIPFGGVILEVWFCILDFGFAFGDLVQKQTNEQQKWETTKKEEKNSQVLPRDPGGPL